MKVLITDNSHFYRTPDGKYYTPSIYNNDFFQRYLDVFDEVKFVAKTKHVDKLNEAEYILVDIKGVEIYELPWYQGLRGLLSKLPKLIIRYINAAKDCQCYIFRVAQIESYLAYLLSRKRGIPYAVEVVNDPATFVDMNMILKKVSCKILEFMVMKANGASYVTEHYLQNLYPSYSRIKGETKLYFETYYSSIELDINDLKKVKEYDKDLEKIKIMHIANSINSDIKGHTAVMDVTKKLVDYNYNIEVNFIGDGSYVHILKDYARTLGIDKRVNFVGRLSGRELVLATLAKGDLFLYPTQMEGLPRALIEAMATGLPCLSTPVAGIPELLDEKYLFQPGDIDGFAYGIMRLLNNTSELGVMSKTNIEVAGKYTKDKLKERRTSFYLKLKHISEKGFKK